MKMQQNAAWSENPAGLKRATRFLGAWEKGCIKNRPTIRKDLCQQFSLRSVQICIPLLIILKKICSRSGGFSKNWDEGGRLQKWSVCARFSVTVELLPFRCRIWSKSGHLFMLLLYSRVVFCVKCSRSAGSHNTFSWFFCEKVSIRPQFARCQKGVR